MKIQSNDELVEMLHTKAFLAMLTVFAFIKALQLVCTSSEPLISLDLDKVHLYCFFLARVHCSVVCFNNCFRS